jgi:hypothetical protein
MPLIQPDVTVTQRDTPASVRTLPRPTCRVPQDGKDIKPSERIAARQVAAELAARLREELAAEGVDVGAAGSWEDDSGAGGGQGDGEVKETGYVDENGALRRPWCPATRILEHREAVGALSAMLGDVSRGWAVPALAIVD